MDDFNDDIDDVPQNTGKGKKNKKKGKNKGGGGMAKRLEQKKTERQEGLFGRYQEITGSLEAKYDEYFTEDSENYLIFEELVTSLVSWYDDKNNSDKIMDDSIYEAKLEELETTWDELLSLMKSTWEEDNAEAIAEKEEERRLRAQQKRIAELEAAGLKVGPAAGNKNKQSKKMSEKQRMKMQLREAKKMQERLKKIDLEQKEKEDQMRNEQKKKELELKKQKEKEKQEKLKKEKEKQAKQLSDTYLLLYSMYQTLGFALR